MDRVDRGELPIHRALAMTQEEKLIRELILQLKLGRLKAAYFQEKFSTNILERFAEPLRKLEGEGHLTIADDQIALNRESLLQVDQLLHEFFLPQHRSARYT